MASALCLQPPPLTALARAPLRPFLLVGGPLNHGLVPPETFLRYVGNRERASLEKVGHKLDTKPTQLVPFLGSFHPLSSVKSLPLSALQRSRLLSCIAG